MKKEQVQKQCKEPRPISITIRVTRAQSKFMHDNRLSPTAIINIALEEMGCLEQ